MTEKEKKEFQTIDWRKYYATIRLELVLIIKFIDIVLINARVDSNFKFESIKMGSSSISSFTIRTPKLKPKI